MKTNDTQAYSNSKGIYSYAKLKVDQKISDLVINGLYLETIKDRDYLTKLFFLRGFFVELNISYSNGTILDILPFNHGYRLDYFSEGEFCNAGQSEYAHSSTH